MAQWHPLPALGEAFPSGHSLCQRQWDFSNCFHPCCAINTWFAMMGTAAGGSQVVEVHSNAGLGEQNQEGEVQLVAQMELGTTFLPLSDSILCF